MLNYATRSTGPTRPLRVRGVTTHAAFCAPLGCSRAVCWHALPVGVMHWCWHALPTGVSCTALQAELVLTGVEGVISPGVRELRQSGYRCWQNLQCKSERDSRAVSTLWRQQGGARTCKQTRMQARAPHATGKAQQRAHCTASNLSTCSTSPPSSPRSAAATCSRSSSHAQQQAREVVS